MFVKDASANELGTSRSSINRTSKTNAAKGVHNHYNEYKDFHSREVKAHICTSFMEMCGMSKLDGIILPISSLLICVIYTITEKFISRNLLSEKWAIIKTNSNNFFKLFSFIHFL